jgi:hypothetical protein
VDRSATLAATKVAGTLLRLLFLPRPINRNAVRAGEMDDQPCIVIHFQMMDFD